MSITIKYFRIRLLILFALVSIAVGFAAEPGAAVACEKCVFPTGGICVGCLVADEGEEGYRTCTAHQSTCTCTVGGGTCRGDGGITPGGGGDN
ncbi:MAG TPA: hypothetical protein VFS10_09270 [Pyrinomonadaceae bacterium]|nr:hypothetical protein [Pyrinomonadaceae bacterium]